MKLETKWKNLKLIKGKLKEEFNARAVMTIPTF
jgi:hypothetical protein